MIIFHLHEVTFINDDSNTIFNFVIFITVYLVSDSSNSDLSDHIPLLEDVSPPRLTDEFAPSFER